MCRKDQEATGAMEVIQKLEEGREGNRKKCQGVLTALFIGNPRSGHHPGDKCGVTQP